MATDFGWLVGRHSNSFPSLSNNQLSDLQLDSSGRLIVAGRFLEDSAHNSGDPGLQILAVRQDTLSSSTDTDGDYSSLKVDAEGELYVTDKDVNANLETIKSNQTNATQKSQITNVAGTNSAEVDSDKNLHVETHGNDPQGTDRVIAVSGILDSNTTTTPIAADQTFTGGFVDCTQYSSIIITILTDQDSATDGLVIEYSDDGTNIIRNKNITLQANDPAGVVLAFPCFTKFFRIKYTNGPIDQTIFRLQTTLKMAATGPTVIPVDQPLTDDNSVSVSRAIATGKSPDGTYVNQPAGGESSDNSTNTPLLANDTFVGEFIDLQGFGGVTITISTDQAGTLLVENSSDGSNITVTDTFDILGDAPAFIGVAPKNKFVRIRYVNGNVDQTELDLQTLLPTQQLSPSSQSISSDLESSSIATTTRSVITGLDETGEFKNIGVSPSGSLKVAQTDRPSEVRDRVHVDVNVEAVELTTTPTVIHTVTSGYTFYLNSILVSALNEGNTTGRLIIQDGGNNKIPFVLPKQASGASAPANVSSPPLPEPIPFFTNVSAVELAGNITASITLVGYEEPN